MISFSCFYCQIKARFRDLTSLTQIYQVSTFKIRGVKFGRKQRDSHRTEAAGMNKAPQQTRIELPMSTQNICVEKKLIELIEKKVKQPRSR